MVVSDTDPVAPIRDAVLRALQSANAERSLSRVAEDLALLWTAIETCECPEWATGNKDAVAQALERVAMAALKSDTRAATFPAVHMCKDSDHRWVPCPPDLCEAVHLVAELQSLLPGWEDA